MSKSLNKRYLSFFIFLSRGVKHERTRIILCIVSLFSFYLLKLMRRGPLYFVHTSNVIYYFFIFQNDVTFKLSLNF